MKICRFILVFVLISGQLFGQVDKIKSSSSNSGSGKSNESGGGSVAGVFFDFFLNVFIEVLPAWHNMVLSQKEVNPSVISLETMLQMTAQPSAYYVYHPRIRGNYGLFAADFRVNYLVQADIDGHKDLTTFDWQVIQLNLFAMRHVIGRAGIGVMAENYGAYRNYVETTAGINLYSSNRKLCGSMEYRSTGNVVSGVAARREVSAAVEIQILEKGSLHTYATLGGMYQQYYEAISVWGIQGGLVFKVY